LSRARAIRAGHVRDDADALVIAVTDPPDNRRLLARSPQPQTKAVAVTTPTFMGRMARSTRDTILAMLRAEGATETQATRIVTALEEAGLNPPAMRVWLHHPERAYAVSIGVMLGARRGVEEGADARGRGRSS
jgi:hypothetical protein